MSSREKKKIRKRMNIGNRNKRDEEALGLSDVFGDPEADTMFLMAIAQEIGTDLGWLTYEVGSMSCALSNWIYHEERLPPLRPDHDNDLISV